MRFEILQEVIDCFIVCESIFDHRGNKKKINFKLENSRFKNKVIHLIHDKPFKNKNDAWKNQAEQREYIFNALSKARKDDYIMFSDPDEIPNPLILKKLNLNINLLDENDFKKLLLSHYSFLKRPVLLFNRKIFVGNSKKNIEEAEIELIKK